MDFLLVDGYIKFPKCEADGRYLLDDAAKELYLQGHADAQIEELPQPSPEILAAVDGKYFERYSEAQEYLVGWEGQHA